VRLACLCPTAHAQVDPLPGIKEAGLCSDADSAWKYAPHQPAARWNAQLAQARKLAIERSAYPKKSTDPELSGSKNRRRPATSAAPKWILGKQPPSQKPPNPLLSSPWLTSQAAIADPAAWAPSCRTSGHAESLPSGLELTAISRALNALIQPLCPARGMSSLCWPVGRLMAGTPRVRHHEPHRFMPAASGSLPGRGNQYFQPAACAFQLIEANGEMEDVLWGPGSQQPQRGGFSIQSCRSPHPLPDPDRCPARIHFCRRSPDCAPPIPGRAHPLGRGKLFDANFGDNLKFKASSRRGAAARAGLQRR